MTQEPRHEDRASQKASSADGEVHAPDTPDMLRHLVTDLRGRLGIARDAVLRLVRVARQRVLGLPRAARLSIYGLGGVLGLWMVVVALVMARLAFGPIAIDGLAPRVLAAVQERLPAGYMLRATGASLTRGAGGIGVSLSEVDITDETGRHLLIAPRITVGLGTFGAITGNPSPRRLILSSPRISLTERDDAASALNAADIVAASFAILNTGTGIEELRIYGASLTAFDGEVGFDGLSARFIAEDTDGPASIAVEIAAGRDRDSEWAMNGRVVRREDGGISGELAFADIVPDALIATGGPISKAFSVESPISGQIAFATLADGSLTEGRFDVIVGAGNVRVGSETSFLLDEARISGLWDAPRHVVRIIPSRFLAGRSRAVLGGEIAFPGRRSMRYGTIPMGIALTDIQIATAENIEPVAIDAIVLDAVYDVANRSARISRFDLLAGDASVSMVGFFQNAPGSPGLALRGEAARMSIDTFKALWPGGLAPATRDWTMRQVKKGTVERAAIVIDVRPGLLADATSLRDVSGNVIRVNFELSGADFGYFRDMPPIRDARLRGTWTPSRFEIELVGETAHIDLVSGERIALTGGSYRVLDTRAAIGRADVEIRTKGTFPAHLELFDHPPFRVASSRNLEIAATSGDATMKMTMALPLRDGLRLPDTALVVDADIDALRIPAGGERTIEEAQVNLTIRNGLLRAVGEGQLDGVPAELSLTETLYGDVSTSEHKVTLILDAKARAALGLDFGTFLEGTFPVEVVELGEGRRRVRADLKSARLYQPAFGLDKPIGSPAIFTAVMAPDGDNGKATRLTDMLIDGREVYIAGNGLFGADGQILSLDLDNVRLQPEDSARVRARTDANGALNIDIEAARFDMRRVIDNAKTGGIADGGAREGVDRRFQINAVIGSARGYNGQVLQSVDIDLDLRGDTIGNLRVTGAFDNNATMQLSMVRRQGADLPELRMSSNDAGRFLKWLDMYSRVSGGEIGMRARIGPGTGDASGRMQITRFSIERDPGLSLLIAQTRDLVEDPSWSAAAEEQPDAANVGFDELYVAFQRSRGRFRFTDGVLRGPAVGATFGGDVDFGAGRIAMNGTYVPLYAINNFFGQIPLLGPILGGRSDEGLIGINFTVQGNLDRPNLVVNPVSAVTPGIFRSIFGQPQTRSGTPQPSRNLAPQPGRGDALDPLSQQSDR